MAVFTDQLISCLKDWKDHDSKLSILSELETTSIEAKARLAQNEIETEVTGFLLAHSGLSEGAARELLKKVVITEPLARWHSLLTLSLFYADLASLQNNSLHREQADYYERKATAAHHQLTETGVGIVNRPIPQAGVPALIVTPGTNSPRFLRGRIQYLREDGAAGVPSAEFILDLTNGETANLRVSSLPANGWAWNAYLGESSAGLQKANSSPLFAGEEFEVVAGVPAPGAEALISRGQEPDYYVVRTNKIWS